MIILRVERLYDKVDPFFFSNFFSAVVSSHNSNIFPVYADMSQNKR